MLMNCFFVRAAIANEDEEVVSWCGTPPHGDIVDDEPTSTTRGVVHKDKRWLNGKTITVAFNFYNQDFRYTPICRSVSTRSECEARIKTEVATAANTWSRYGNIRFKFDVPWDQGEIRVRFEGGGGGHSMIGTGTLSVRKPKPTMVIRVGGYGLNRTTLHEFGHALGFKHEHQNPNIRYSWNAQQIAQDLGWSVEKVTEQVTKPVNRSDRIHKTDLFITEFDPLSIMVYTIRRSWVSAADNANPAACPSKSKEYCVEPTSELSKVDKWTIAKMYPFATVTAITKPTAPQRVSAKAVSNNRVQLSWSDNSDNEAGFYIYRWEGENRTWVKIAKVKANVTAFTDSQLKKRLNYYTVSSYNEQGESKYNGYVSIKTSLKRQLDDDNADDDEE